MSYFKPVFRFFRRPLKRVKLYLKQKSGWLGIPKIIVYRGFGNEEEICVTGRVIEDSGLTKPGDKQKVWQNILAAIKRFSSDEIAGVKVRAIWNGKSKSAVTDEYGYFNFRFKTGLEEISEMEKNWYSIDVELLDKIVENQPEIKAKGEISIIPFSQKRIIVSDIDDTVLVSHSTQTLKKLRLMLLKNAYTRLPFEGGVDFFRALQKGKTGNENYPFFFVSSSEWNLYDLLDDFFSYHQIPKAVLILRKMKYNIYQFWKSGRGNHELKYEKIKLLIQFYKDQKFILIGDSGQSDPEIYKRLSLEFPGRVEAIYIRIVKSKKKADLSAFQKELLSVNTTFTEVEDSGAAINHAKLFGLIE